MRLNGVVRALVAVAIGITAGMLAERIPSPPPLRGGVALVGAWLVSGLVAALLRLVGLRNHDSVVAVSFGIPEAALSFVVLLAAGLAIYLTLAALGALIHPGLTGWRTLLLGVTGALAGAGVSSSEVASNQRLRQ